MPPHDTLTALIPVILLLSLGVVAAIGSRAVGVSPIVGYLLLGLGLRAESVELVADSGTVAVLAELGVVFLLFDIGLHFSLQHLREQARDVFGFGPVQVVAGAIGLGAVGLAFGLTPLAAAFVGATLALSSTAVVARLIAERHQQNCPVGLTATAILIFQDVAAIFLLIVAGALNGDPAAVLPAAGLALLKAVAAFAIAVVLARVLVRPLFGLVARSLNEEVFTAMALLVALAAGWATGRMGLSLTLGAFLGGMIVAETPYRAIVQSEIKPFRGLLLGFFFVSVGLSIDVAVLARAWPAVIGVAGLLIGVKVLTNAMASLAFRWSVPGSIQLGFLLAEGSEFAFVVLSLPPARGLIGEERASVLVAVVALTLALTPSLAEAGRSIAGRLRARRARQADPELQQREITGPVFIVGMGPLGRTLADALNEFQVGYDAIERDERRLRDAIADGYAVEFGDAADPRIWEPVAMQGRQIAVLTVPSLERATEVLPLGHRLYPNLTFLGVAAGSVEAESFRAIGLEPIVDRSSPPGLDLAAAVLRRLSIDDAAVEAWAAAQQKRASGITDAVAVAA